MQRTILNYLRTSFFFIVERHFGMSYEAPDSEVKPMTYRHIDRDYLIGGETEMEERMEG